MLNKPPLNQLMSYVDSKYTLVIVASKRARATIENEADMLHNNKINPVSMALEEVSLGKIVWNRTKDGIK